jgi:hypothetical protein
MARKQFDAKFWRENFGLLKRTTNEHDDEQSEELMKYSRKAFTINRILKKSKSISFAKDLNELASKINDESWLHFLKRVRDKRYEETRARKRLTISDNNYDKIQKLVKSLSCVNPDQLLKLLMDDITTEQRRTIKAEAKKLNNQ